MRESLFFLRAEVGLRPDALARAVRRLPALLTQPADQLAGSLDCAKELAPTLNVPVEVRSALEVLLTAPAEQQATCEALTRRGADLPLILSKLFTVLAMPSSRAAEVLRFLEEEAGFDAAPCGALVSSYPAMLTYSPEKQLRPLIDFLREHGLEPADERCHPLYAWPNTERLLRPALRLLRDEAGYDEAELLARPVLLGYSCAALPPASGSFHLQPGSQQSGAPPSLSPLTLADSPC